jgi:hypothetical protein
MVEYQEVKRPTMTKKLLIATTALVVVLVTGIFVAGAVSAQSPTQTPAPQGDTQTTTKSPLGGWGRGCFGMLGGGDMSNFDLIAETLKLTPTQLFEQLHAGKTLDEIATAQGVTTQAIQDALSAARLQNQKDAIAQAVKDGKMTQEQADWLLQGLDKGFMGRGGFGFGHGMRGGMRGGMKGLRGEVAPKTTAPATGTAL